MKDIWKLIRTIRPMVHMITNPVTVNDTVNIVLAAGGTAICGSDPEESAEITAVSDALLLNCGMPSKEKASAMILSGQKANAMGIPVVLDPVGAGVSRFRNRIIENLLQNVKFAVIRGNVSEIKALCELLFGEASKDLSAEAELNSGGVEAEPGTELTDREMQKLSERTGAVIVATGRTDRIAYASHTEKIYGGTVWQTRVTGSGCMLSGLLAAAAGAVEKQRKQFEDEEWNIFQAAREVTEQYGRLAMQAMTKNRTESVSYAGAGDRSGIQTDAETVSRTEGETDVGSGHRPGIEAKPQSSIGRDIGTGTFIVNMENLLSQGFIADRQEKIRKALLLYAITDRRMPGGDITMEQAVEEAVQGGATMIQYREKELPDNAFIEEALRLREITRRYHVPLILNDRAHLLYRIGADGIHLGQEDMRVSEARNRFGPDLIIGATAHNVQEAQEAEAEGADYLGVGAAFGSSTKTDAHGISLAEYVAITSSVSIPVVAIGGINVENIEQLGGLGLSGAAVISGIFSVPDVRRSAEILHEKCVKFFSHERRNS